MSFVATSEELATKVLIPGLNNKSEKSLVSQQAISLTFWIQTKP